LVWLTINFDIDS